MPSEKKLFREWEKSVKKLTDRYGQGLSKMSNEELLGFQQNVQEIRYKVGNPSANEVERNLCAHYTRLKHLEEEFLPGAFEARGLTYPPEKSQGPS